MGFERDYQIRILSKEFNRKGVRFYSTLPLNEINLNPWFVTGFRDGEGCFSIKITKSSTNRIGFQVQLLFSIGLHVKDIVLLESIKTSLGGLGKISNTKNLFN